MKFLKIKGLKMNTDGKIKYCDKVTEGAWKRALDVLKPSKKQLEHGLELHKNIFAMDTFGFLPQGLWTEELAKEWKELKDGNVGARELSKRMEFRSGTAMIRDIKVGKEFISAIKATGLNCMVQTVAEGKSRKEDIRRMSTLVHVCRVFRDVLAQVGSVDEIKETSANGKMAVLWSVNGPPLAGQLQDLDEELGWIETWYNLGVRLMHLTYNRRNFVGDGCAEPANAGLSSLGRDLIKKLNETGIIVDIPHSGIRTTIEAAETSSKPIMASHTGAKGVFNNMRCKTDEELKAIAATGGLIGVYALHQMLGEKATVSTMLDHIDYIAETAGINHVSIGTDSSYHYLWPEGITGYENARFTGNKWWGNWNEKNHPVPASDESWAGSLAWTNWPLYTVGLVTRGYTDQEIEKILGGNFLRVLGANRPEKEIRKSDIEGVSGK